MARPAVAPDRRRRHSNFVLLTDEEQNALRAEMVARDMTASSLLRRLFIEAVMQKKPSRRKA